MFSSLGPMNFRSSHVPAASAKVPKGFSVRIFKGPTLSNFAYDGEPKFDLGYRPKQSANTLQKPNWASTQSKSGPPPRDAPSRTSRVFGNAINSDRNTQRNDAQAPNYSIYPSFAEDTYVYERSLYSKSDTYTDTDISDTTLSPSYFSTALSNDSTTTLHSTANTESLLDEPNTKRSSMSFLAQHPFRVKIPGLGRTLSSSIGVHERDVRSTPFARSSTPTSSIRPSTSFGPCYESSSTPVTSNGPQSSVNLSSFTSLTGPSNDLAIPYPQPTLRSNANREQTSHNLQASRKSANRASFILGGTLRNHLEQNVANYPSREDGSRISSLLAEAGLSDGLSSVVPGDILSAAATKGSSPPRQSSQIHHLGRSATPAPEFRHRQDAYLSTQPATEGRVTNDHPTLRIVTNRDNFLPTELPRRDTDHFRTAIGPTQLTNSDRDRIYVSQRRNSGDDHGSHTISAARTPYEDEFYPAPSMQHESPPLSGVPDQSTQSSRTSEDRRIRSSSQSGIRESETIIGRRGSRPLSQFIDSAGATGSISLSSGTSTRNVRNGFVEIDQSTQGEDEYAPNASYHITNPNLYNRQERVVPRTNPPADFVPSVQTTPPMYETPPLSSNRETYSTSVANGISGRATPVHHQHARKDANGRVTPSPIAESLSNNNGGPQNPSYRIRQNLNERQRNTSFSTQHTLSVANAYLQEDAIAYPDSAPREPIRGSEFDPALQARHDAEIYQRREYDDRRASPTWYEGEALFDADSGRRTKQRPNQTDFHVSTIEQRALSEGLDDPGPRSATPGGTRCVRWNPNLIAPSPIFPSQRRKGWFNRRGDQLWTNDGSYKPAPADQEYPLDLADYPDYGGGWMNEAGVRIDMRHRLIPKPPLRSALKRT